MTSLQAGAFVNMDALQRSIQRFTDTIKTMKKHACRSELDVVFNLLDEQFILPIQTLSAPHTSTSLCPVVDKPSSSYCSISRKLRIHCERCMFTQTIETKGDFDFKAASQAKVSNYRKQKGQKCQKVLLRTGNMMKIRMTEMTLQWSFMQFLVDYVTDDLYILEIVI